MTTKDKINNEYFEWMLDVVYNNKYSKEISYRKLLMHLHNTEFVYSIPKDENRAIDGVDLRYRFALLKNYKEASNYIEGPCSVLEMMVALSIHCEDIMDDPNFGNRTGQWFWGMISSLGIGSMTDERFDRRFVDYILKRFLNREYEPDGRGGLFTIKNCDRDLRTVEIFYQLCYYLDTIM